MAFTVVRIGKMASTNVDSFVKSAIIVAGTPLSNGSVVVLKGKQTGDLNVYVASTPADVTAEEVYLVESPILIEVNGLRLPLADPRLFQNPVNTAFRVRKLVAGDTLTMTIDGFSGTPVIDQFVVPVNGAFTLAPAATLAGATLVAFKVNSVTRVVSIGQEQVTAYEIEVVRAV